MKSLTMFDLTIVAETFDQSVILLLQELDGNRQDAKIVVTPNVDHVVKLSKNNYFKTIYRNAEYIFADGFPVVLLSRLLYGRRGMPERVTGADLFPAICAHLSEKGGKIFLLGGHPNQSLLVREKLSDKYPEARIEVYSPSFNFSVESAEAFEAVTRINSFNPDVTFVCLGMPKQELWSFHHKNQLKTKLICCFGAAFEFDLGFTKRAPKFIQWAGFEWLWRLLSNPKRLARRYFVEDPFFVKIAFDECWRKIRKP